MTIRVLRYETVPAIERPALWVDDSAGYRQLFNARGDEVDSENQDRLARTAAFIAAAGPLTGKSVAWIGGGLCYGIRCFAAADCKQTVYELQPECVEFCQPGVTFIPGDYRDTLNGTYDVIVYDLGGDAPREFLTQFLNPGGILLPQS